MAKNKAVSPLAERLKYLQEQCGLTTCPAADRSGGQGLPLGRGQSCHMEEATLRFNKNNDPMITWHLVGTDEGCNDGKGNVNRHEFVNINLREDAKSFPYAKADVEAMGGSWENEIESCLTTLAKHPDATAVHIEGVEGLEVLVDVWESKDGEFTNQAIVGLAEGEASGPDEDKPAEEAEASEEGGEIGFGVTADDIKAMADDELDDLAIENGLDPALIETYDELKDMLIKKLT